MKWMLDDIERCCCCNFIFFQARHCKQENAEMNLGMRDQSAERQRRCAAAQWLFQFPIKKES